MPARLSDRQFITGGQAPPLVTAQGAQGIGRTTAQHDWHIDATGHGDIGAGTDFREIEAQHLPGAYRKRRIVGHLHTVKPRGHVRTADSHQGVDGEFQFRPQQRAFQCRRPRRVADQAVGRAQGVLVQRPRGRDAEVVIAFAAKVLHRGGQAGFEYLDHASTSCNVLG
ncbi:hypothetical protein D9M71_492150 [compost metagenome]